MSRLQRWDLINGVLTRRGHTSIIPGVVQHSAGILRRAELSAPGVVAAADGILYRAELNAAGINDGRLYRAELDTPVQATITSVPLSSFRQSGDTFEVALTRPATDTIVDLEGTTQVFADFNEGYYDGIYQPHIIGFTNGTLEMSPNTSSYASAVNAQTTGTVAETLIRLGRGGGTYTNGAYFGATLQGTAQGHIYNGLVVYYCTNAIVENCSFLAIPGASSAPPGETFPINNYLSNNTTIRNVLVDGQGASATGIGHNQANGILVQNSTFQNMGHGAGVSQYECTNITYENCTFQNNHSAGANFEKNNATSITMVGCTFHNNGHNMIVDTDGSSSIVKIYDPIWDGMNSGVPFKVCVHSTYAYPPVANPPANKQLPSDIHLYIGGVDVTATKLQVTTN
ncbi:right-handed parallel beta-helix repeat-containing protein [Leifsonia sp. NPDC056824]|uniref:right-handed parallel beta-helix repeat-containing protein n=1 Tax=Leifsonia sp. NPDC056824 TaxID=3345953 RepID=UPI003693BB9A